MQTKYDLPFCGLSMKLYSTGKKTPSYEYSGEASKVKFMCSLTKRKYSLSQVTEWFQTPEVQKYVQAGYVLKYMTKIQETNNPSPYAKSNLEQVFCLVMVKKQNRPAQNVDGLKPVAETIPQVQQPTASDESFDDDLAPF
ncbi:MAG: hypothetical protein VW438_07000 [Euryarchaeota archaeon]